MNGCQDHWQRDFRGGVEFKDTERLGGPEVLVGGNVPPETACVAESLGFGEIMLATPQGFFDALAVLDVGHDAVPFDDVSFLIAQRQAAVQMPSISPVRAAKTNLAFMRFAACNSRAPFAFVLLKIIRMDCLAPP